MSMGVRTYPVEAGRCGSFSFGSGTSWYGIVDSRCAIMLTRARRLSSDSTTYQGASGMSVIVNMSSFARE